MYGIDIDSPYRLSTSLPSMSILMEKTDTRKDIAIPDNLRDPRDGSRTCVMAMEPSRNMKQSWNLWSSSILNLPKPSPTAPLSMKIVPDIRYNVAQRS